MRIDLRDDLLRRRFELRTDCRCFRPETYYEEYPK
jgi:hypothetical protein